MTDITRKPSGSFRMSRKHLYRQNQRLQGETMKEKELKCLTCGSMPWRVEGIVCKDCGLEFAEEVIEQEMPTLRSVAGNFEDDF